MELLEIFKKNILLEDAKKLSSPKSTDVIARFVGDANTTIVHKYTGKSESLFDFIVRHTMGRPRDLMEIGREIRNLRPPRNTEELRLAVFRGAHCFVLKNFKDMAAFIPVPELGLLRLIKKNVLSEKELEIISKEYNNKMQRKGKYTNGHPFCALYRIGFLGTLNRNYSTGDITQIFPHPDAFPTDEMEDILPRGTKFLIHPALDDFVSHAGGGEYQLNFERSNLIGDGLPWKDTRLEKYVLKGDIVGYSEVMQSPEYNRSYTALFNDWAEEACEGIQYHKVSGGDSIMIVDGSPTALIRAAKVLARKVAEFEGFPRKMRFGGSSGVIEYMPKAEGGEVEPLGWRCARPPDWNHWLSITPF